MNAVKFLFNDADKCEDYVKWHLR